MDLGFLAFSGSVDFGFPDGTNFFFSPNGVSVGLDVFNLPSPVLGSGPIVLAGDLASFFLSAESSLPFSLPFSLPESFSSLSFVSSLKSSASSSSSKPSSFFFSSFFGLGCAAISLRALMNEMTQRTTKINKSPAEKNITAGFREDA